MNCYRTASITQNIAHSTVAPEISCLICVKSEITGSLTIITFDYTWATCYIKVQSVSTELVTQSHRTSIHIVEVYTIDTTDLRREQLAISRLTWVRIAYTPHITSWAANLLPPQMWGDAKSSAAVHCLVKINWMTSFCHQRSVGRSPIPHATPFTSTRGAFIHIHRLTINRQNRPIMCLCYKHVSLHNTFTFWTHLKVVRRSTS